MECVFAHFAGDEIKTIPDAGGAAKIEVDTQFLAFRAGDS